MKIKDNPCKLYCKPRSERFFKNFNDIVTDGTSCSKYSNDVCVHGICKVSKLKRSRVIYWENFIALYWKKISPQKVGCDWILDSPTQEDSCGVCGGDDSSCDFYNGQIQVTSIKKAGNKHCLFRCVVNSPFLIHDREY